MGWGPGIIKYLIFVRCDGITYMRAKKCQLVFIKGSTVLRI